MQKYNIQLNMNLEEFRRLIYVFTNHGMEEAQKETYGRDDKIKATERVEKKLSELYNMVNKASDGIDNTIDVNQLKMVNGNMVSFRPPEYDVINISVDSYEYKNFK